MTNPTPLEDRNWTEVLARIAFRLIELDYHRNPTRYADPPGGILELAVEMQDAHFTMLSAWLAAYAAAKRRRPANRLELIKVGFIERSAQNGVSWRHVAFPEYKANRRER